MARECYCNPPPLWYDYIMDTTPSVILKQGVRYCKSGAKDAGFETETNDCFVHAIKHVAGVPYRDAHAYVTKRYGRKPRKATYNVVNITAEIATRMELVYGYRVIPQILPTKYVMRRGYQRRQMPTMAGTIDRMRKGRYIVWSRNHAWAVIDGVVYDNGAASGRTQVNGFYEFVPSSQLEGK